MPKRKNWIHICIFAVLLVGLILGLNKLLKPKWSLDYRSGSNIRGFYQMPKDSIDVLIVGSSNVICGVNANTMLSEAGISAWSCGTEAQPIFGSLAWIREASHRHQLSAVVLDLGSLFDSYDEVNYRKSLDYMRLSPVKMQILMDYHNRHPDTDLKSYLLPLFQYHGRWSELSQEDFQSDGSYLKGFYIRNEIRGAALEGIHPEDDRIREIPEEKLADLRAIITFCHERNIQLILINCPSARITAAEHNAIEGIAAEHGLPFLDFNQVSLWDNIDYAQDMADFQHFNVSGADKATRYIIEVLTSRTSLPDRRSEPIQIQLAGEYSAALVAINAAK